VNGFPALAQPLVASIFFFSISSAGCDHTLRRRPESLQFSDFLDA
jgi:hypothetical protein